MKYCIENAEILHKISREAHRTVITRFGLEKSLGILAREIEKELDALLAGMRGDTASQ
jgi:hypothetical protein